MTQANSIKKKNIHAHVRIWLDYCVEDAVPATIHARNSKQFSDRYNLDSFHILKAMVQYCIFKNENWNIIVIFCKIILLMQQNLYKVFRFQVFFYQTKTDLIWFIVPINIMPLYIFYNYVGSLNFLSFYFVQFIWRRNCAWLFFF